MPSKFSCRDCYGAALCLIRVNRLATLSHMGWLEATCVRCGRGWVVYQNSVMENTGPRGKNVDETCGCPSCLEENRMGRMKFIWRCRWGACYELTVCATTHARDKWSVTSSIHTR